MLRNVLLALIGLLWAASQTAYGQQSKLITLYKPERPMQSGDQLSAAQLRRQPITLNSLVTQPDFLETGDRIRVPLGETSKTFQIERKSQYAGETYSVIARSVSRQEQLLSFTMEGQRILGTIHLHDRGELYQLAYDSLSDTNYLAGIDYRELDILSCPGSISPDAIVPSNWNSSQGGEFAAEETERVHIDLLILYTNHAKEWILDEYSSVNLFISEIINRSQMALDNSNIHIDFRLAHSAPTDYNEDSDNSSGTLSKLRDPGDGSMDKVHSLRDEHVADLVALLAYINDVGGRAYRLNSPSGAPASGFSINRVQQLDNTFTFAHELGHNMGNAHSRNQFLNSAPPDGGIFEYSTGWRWTGNDGEGYVSVMTYEEGDREAPHFSNPDILYKGTPTGISTGPHSGQYGPANNARSMNEMRNVISSYRDITPALSAPADGRREVSITPELRWGDARNAFHYEFQIATSPKFDNIVLDQAVYDSTHQIRSPLDYATTYYWRVRGVTPKRKSEWSTPYSFQTIIEPPAVTRPAEGTIQVPLRPTFAWERSEGATGYQLQIATTANFVSPGVDVESDSASFKPDQPLQEGTIYYWRVRGKDSTSNGKWSQTASFTTVVEETEIDFNYPNPFRGRTTIRYQIANPSDVLLEVYNTAGRKVRTLVAEQQQPRVYNYSFDGADIASGVYLVRLIAGEDSDVLMMTLIK